MKKTILIGSFLSIFLLVFTSCHSVLGYQAVHSTRNSPLTRLQKVLTERKTTLTMNNDVNFFWLLIQWILDYAKIILQILFTGYWEPFFYIQVSLTLLISIMFVPLIIVLSMTAVPVALLVAIPLSIVTIAYLVMALTILSDDDEQWYPSYFMMKIKEVIEKITEQSEWYPGFLFINLYKFFTSDKFTWFPGITLYILGYTFFSILLYLMLSD